MFIEHKSMSEHMRTVNTYILNTEALNFWNMDILDIEVLQHVWRRRTFLTRGDRIFILELARGSFQDENSENNECAQTER